ncbi:hypothetical protein CS022_02675 [Veronia nyctiphanis]|uniref:Uncharacterized protein n=1 Tax=Veronia nyctiphanis TaxID=1278244 RepID=A0A4Q0YZD7_9GAMM|nr:hypothetical protein [Veronia nyctiphanis]RXJ74501.1 hypothetical protein CS022_02675 [Veronia nyctiphanis]
MYWQTVFYALETVLLITGSLMLARSAFQYASRTGDWHHVSAVFFNTSNLSKDELRWWILAVSCLVVGFTVKFSSYFFYLS